jgi:hypothetical protein
MPCDALVQLRKNATRVREDLQAQKAKMRKFAGKGDRLDARPGGDMEEYLARKLQRVSDEIERHIKTHQCQD